MMGIKVTIERFAENSQPGWVECRLIDAAGAHHLFEEKVPVVTVDVLDAQSEYPREGIIGCTLVHSRVTDNGRELVTVNTELPWGIESKSGQVQFEILRQQVVEFSNQAG